MTFIKKPGAAHLPYHFSAQEAWFFKARKMISNGNKLDFLVQKAYFPFAQPNTASHFENQLANCAQTNTLQNGQRDLGNAITQGFASTAYETQEQTCDIIYVGAQNTQRIIDVLNIHWNQDLQQRYNDARLELSQQRQNAALIANLKTTSTSSSATS